MEVIVAKYRQYEKRPENRRDRQAVHPLWRGIGCLMMILIPIMAYAGAVLLVQENLRQRWLVVPREFARIVSLPLIGDVPYLYANLVTAAILALFGFGLITVVFTLFYRMIGPPRLGPTDAPPDWGRSGRRR
jgi:hypothetical protein